MLVKTLGITVAPGVATWGVNGLALTARTSPECPLPATGIPAR